MAISFIGGTPPGRGDGTLEKHSEGVTFRRPSIRDGLNVSDCRPLLVALIASIPAAAQAPPRAPKPYAPVAITRPAASDDASFVAFRAALAGVIGKQYFAAALLWWRFYTFYIYIVLGAIVAGNTALRAVRKTQDLEEEFEDADDQATANAEIVTQARK